MPKAKRERRPVNWEKMQSLLDQGLTDSQIAKKMGYWNDKAKAGDENKQFRALKSQGRASGKLKPNSKWYQRTAGATKKKVAKKVVVKAKKVAKGTKKAAIKKAVAKAAVSPKPMTAEDLHLTVPGDLVRLETPRGVLLIPKPIFLGKFGPVVKEIELEATIVVSQAVADAGTSEFPIPETKPEVAQPTEAQEVAAA